MLATKNPYIKSAYEQLQVISQDKQKRLEYEAREKAVRDHNQMMYEAEQRGIQQGIQQTAKSLLLMGMEIEKISKATGLSIYEIEQL